MQLKLVEEIDVLDINFRKAVIESIEGSENISRKKALRKRYEVFKDNTAQFVIENLRSELGSAVVKEIIHRTSNISIARKIVEKKAMVYKDGVKRETEEKNQIILDELVDIYNINSVMKKVNKYLELFRNTDIYVYPYVNKKNGLWELALRVLRPYDYDVIEDCENPEEPRCYILSYFKGEDNRTGYADENSSGYHGKNMAYSSFRAGDNRNQVIADSPSDEGAEAKEYVWWTTNYHFTTNVKGEVIESKSPEELQNPINKLPFVNFAKEKDGSFWSIGGDDLVDGSILINTLLTDLYYISKLQGMGIFYLFGKGVPKSVKIGPSDAIILDVEDESPTPSIGFASSNPPIESHMKMIEQYMAMLLSTNNLEVTTVQGSLSATTAASGIQEIIRRAENMDDLEDQREQYRDKEPEVFNILSKWINAYADTEEGMSDRVTSLGTIDEEMTVNLKFAHPTPFTSEKERLEIIQLRRDLTLDSPVDSIMKDNSDLSEEEAEQKLLKILEAKLKYGLLSKSMFQEEPEEEPEKNPEEEEEDEEVEEVKDEEVEDNG